MSLRDFLAFMKLSYSTLRKLEFNYSERNRALRVGIVESLIGQILTDDERAKLLGLPDGCRIREGAKIISREMLEIGPNCWIGEGAMLDASGGLSIGSNCSIGLGVMIWSHTSHLAALSGKNHAGSHLIERRQTRIGDNVFVGGPSVIMPGAVIGDRVVIKPFSIVTGYVESGSLVGQGGIQKDVFTLRNIEIMEKLRKTQHER